MKASEIYPKIKICSCGSRKFRPISGYLDNSTEIICAECGRTALINRQLEKIGDGK